MEDKRLTDRLTNYWYNLRRDTKMPEFSHFNAATVDDVWQQCILFTVMPAAAGRIPNLNFYRIGDKLRNIYSPEMIGQTFNPAQRHFQAAAVVRKLDVVLADPVPLIDIGQFISEKGKIVKYRSCLLPFGRDDQLTHVLAGLSWREF